MSPESDVSALISVVSKERGESASDQYEHRGVRLGLSAGISQESPP